MPYKDPIKRRENQRERSRRYRRKKKIQKYGEHNADVDLRGKHGNQAKAAANGRWSGTNKIISEHGYVKIRVGMTHPLADPNGYAYEHLLVWISSGNKIPTENELLHHKNEVKTDNRIENLKLMQRSDHGKYHITDRERDAAGRLLDGREWSEMPHVAAVT